MHIYLHLTGREGTAAHLAQEGEGEPARLAQGGPQQAPLCGCQLGALGHSHMLQEALCHTQNPQKCTCDGLQHPYRSIVLWTICAEGNKGQPEEHCTTSISRRKFTSPEST